MAQLTTQSDSNRIRSHVRQVYQDPAVQKGDRVFTVNVGAVHKALALNNRVPLVCAALKSQKFLNENNLRLVSQTGPPSGQSTTVTFTYEILESHAVSPQPNPPQLNPLVGLLGIAKDVFRQLGGGEAFIRSERSSFNEHRQK